MGMRGQETGHTTSKGRSQGSSPRSLALGPCAHPLIALSQKAKAGKLLLMLEAQALKLVEGPHVRVRLRPGRPRTSWGRGPPGPRPRLVPRSADPWRPSPLKPQTLHLRLPGAVPTPPRVTAPDPCPPFFPRFPNSCLTPQLAPVLVETWHPLTFKVTVTPRS